MSSSPASFDAQPLAVVALGGNALSPPSGDSSYTVERQIIEHTAGELKGLIDAGYRLLIIHGNGPQVGRLMRDDVAGDNLDVYVSQTQGELGYLLVHNLHGAGVINSVGIVTRTVVNANDPGLAEPTKAVGAVLANKPRAMSRPVGAGWRLLVGSPQPMEVLELPAIRTLIRHQHVVAGGGGGIPVTAAGQPVQGVVDKDWVAALLAIELEADELVFVTDIDGVYEAFGSPQQKLIRQLDCDRAEALAVRGEFGAGSMGPKVESAVRYCRTQKRSAYIVGLGSIASALQGTAGTRVRT